MKLLPGGAAPGGRIWGLGLLLAWVAGVVALQWLRYRAGFHYEFEDDALYHQMLDNVGRGDLFVNTIHPLHRPSHLPLILVLLWPVHALLGGGWVGLFVIKAVAIGAGAIAVFLLGRSRGLSEPQSLAWGAIYLAFPPTIMLALSTFRPLALAVTPLLFLVWAFSARRFRTYLAVLVVALAVREDVALSAGALAVVALIRRYPAKWALWTALLCGGWFLIVAHVVVPALLPADYLDVVFASNVESGGALAFLGRALEPTHLVALGALLLPLLLLPLGAWEAAIGLIGVAAVLLNKAPLSGNLLHLTAPAVAGALAGATIAHARLRDRAPRLLVWVGIGVLVAHLQPWIAPVVATHHAANGPAAADQTTEGAWSPFHPRYYAGDGLESARAAVLEPIHSDARVSASGHLLPALSPRQTLYEYGHRDTPFAEVDWIVLEARDRYNGAGAYIALTPDALALHLAELRAAFHVEREESGIVLLRRVRSDPGLSRRLRALTPRRDAPPERRRGARSPGEERLP